jgi:membrane-bound lytic murein transglycosylase D
MTSSNLCTATWWRWASPLLAAVALSGCGSLMPQSQPRTPAPITSQVLNPAKAVLQQNKTTQDPTSGLKVDLSAPSLMPRQAAHLPVEPVVEVKLVDPLNPGVEVQLDEQSAQIDLWQRIRSGFQLPPLDSPLVADHERWYAARPEYVARMTQRSSRYLYHIVEEVQRRGMPMEVALLPFIESAFNPQALSSARASGIWQFMPATGKHFDLQQNLFRDDRRDVLASTDAALSYLQRLHRMFGDWHLALAAYNWGEGNVQRAIRRNQQQGLPTDYLSLSMPAETRHYVPKLYAVRNIVEAPEQFNLTLTRIDNHPYFLSVPIERDLDVELAARLAGMPVADFRALNPSMNKPVILAAGTPQVLLPYDNASQFKKNVRAHQGPLASWTAWQVPKTMRPDEAARKVGMSERELREVNRIPPRMLVKAGSTLLVHRSARHEDVSERLADSAMIALAPDAPPVKRRVVRAKSQETVRSLARRFGVTATQVAEWNKVGTKARFDKGQRVVLYLPTGMKNLASDSRKKGTKVAKASRADRDKTKGSRKAQRQSKVRVASVR